ncbi:unnamed protein product, partial [Rotaria sp. Silwood2]
DVTRRNLFFGPYFNDDDDDDDDELAITEDDSIDGASIFDDSFEDLENALLDQLDFERFCVVCRYRPPTDGEEDR